VPSYAASHIRFPLHVYVHCATSVEYLAQLNASIPGVEHYAERALLLAELSDVVCVPQEVEPSYLEYLAELGIGPARENLLVVSRFGDFDRQLPLWRRLLRSNEALALLRCSMQRHGSAWIHPFIGMQGQFDLAAELQRGAGVSVQVSTGNPDVVAYADRKHQIRAKALELGIPVARGEVVDLRELPEPRRQEAMLQRAVERQMVGTGSVIIRGSAGAAGSATFAVKSHDEIPGLVRALVQSENRIYLVEEMVEMRVSPNVQMHIGRDPGLVRCGGVSDQRWDQPLVHGGNGFPSTAHRINDMLAWSRRLAEWLQRAGYYGVAGFDFVEYADAAGNPQAFLAEVNPRTNGATYPLRLRRRLNVSQREAGYPEIAAFASGTVEVEAGSFRELREMWDEQLFCPERGSGLVPYMPGLLQHGKCGVVALAGTREEAEELYQQASGSAVVV
jgi:Pre ATP-grasp domain